MKLDSLVYGANGFLLLNGSNYNDVVTSEQAAVEQYNIIHFLGGSAPYLQYPGFGIDPATPETCTVEQVQFLGRHGERYPTESSSAKYTKTLASLSKQKPFNGTLAFLNDYQYFVNDTSDFGMEVTTSNSQSPYAGSVSAEKDGRDFQAKYGHLHSNDSILPVFTTSSQRVYDTSHYFVNGFLGEGYDESKVKFNVISEDSSMGGNSLTPDSGCSDFDDDFDDSDGVSTYASEFQARMQRDGNPNLSVSTKDVKHLIDICGYELSAKGYSQMCGIFTNEELIKRQYADDVAEYYTFGPGNDLAVASGSVFIKASVKLLQEDNDNKIWLSFAHDDNLALYYAALGLFTDDKDLDKDNYQFKYSFKKAQIVPMSARIVLEKLSCDGTTYVRFIVNDSVVPLDCTYGPGFSCTLDDFVSLVKDVTDIDYNDKCGNKKSVPDEISFYWDYTTTSYNATLEV